MVAEGIVKRLSIYRRLLSGLMPEHPQHIFSHDLASLAGVTAAQVRRDLMTIGYSGSPRRGYDVAGLVSKIGEFLDAPEGQNIVLVGLGHLGQAILAFFSGRRRYLAIRAAFDADPTKVNRVIHGCRCYPMEQLQEIVDQVGAEIGIVAVPGEEAQKVTSTLIRAGIRGLLNFAPAQLQVPEYVFVEDVDITVSLEKIAYFSRQHSPKKEDLR